MKKIVSIILTALLLYSCHDTRSFECARKLKTGMTISEIESIMDEPVSYERVNDSTESRSYQYDSPSSGMDKNIKITFINGKATDIKDSYY
jgi:hypothetical protein